eukprot:5176828-Lingulodinium_polyedra.AAC.1
MTDQTRDHLDDAVRRWLASAGSGSAGAGAAPTGAAAAAPASPAAATQRPDPVSSGAPTANQEQAHSAPAGAAGPHGSDVQRAPQPAAMDGIRG